MVSLNLISLELPPYHSKPMPAKDDKKYGFFKSENRIAKLNWLWDVPKRPPYLWGILKNAAGCLEGFTCRVNAEFFVNYPFQSWLHSNPGLLPAMIVNDFTVTKDHVDKAHQHFLCSQSSTIQFKTIYKRTGSSVILIFKLSILEVCLSISFSWWCLFLQVCHVFPSPSGPLFGFHTTTIQPHFCPLWAPSMVQRLELRTVFRSLFLQQLSD